MSDFLCTRKNKRSILNHNFHFAVLLHFTDGQTANEDIMETLDWIYLPALISSATPKDPKRGQITWIIINSIFGIKKNNFTTSNHVKNTLKEVYNCQGLHSRDVFMNRNTEGVQNTKQEGQIRQKTSQKAWTALKKQSLINLFS